MPALPHILCLPPAGAGPGLFRPWQRLDAGVIAPAIPGREGRFREPAAESLDALAARLAAELLPTLPHRYGMFGYSMGGTLALLLAERLVTMGHPGPDVVFTLGAPPPDRLDEDTASFHLLESDDFWVEIARLGGTPQEILADAEMRALFEPALRQDFRLCALHSHRPGGFRLSCPVHVMQGEQDHLMKPDYAAGWRAFTTGDVVEHRFPGGHMLEAPAFTALIARLRALWPAIAA